MQRFEVGLNLDLVWCRFKFRFSLVWFKYRFSLV